jgi:microcystin-dependent protein
VEAAQVSRIYTFTDGSILTALELNTEFNNLVNAVNSLDGTNLIATANIVPSQLNATLAGNGLIRTNATGVLNVNVDNNTLTIVGNQVEATGIGSNSFGPSFSGVITMYGGATAPAGWFICDGTAYSRTTYANLFAVIGTTYGVGDNVTTFNVPDMRSQMPIGAGPGGNGPGSNLTARTLGTQVGSETHTQVVGELAAHTHGPGSYGTSTDGAHSHFFNFTWTQLGLVGQGFIVNGSNPNLYSSIGGTTGNTFTNTTGAHSHTIASGVSDITGSGTPMNIINPAVVVNYIIKQ